MKNFYIKTALSNLKKNSRLYIPQVISGAVMYSVFYIMLKLCFEDALLHRKGSNYIPTFMGIGCAVMLLLSAVMTFYSNGFLMKQRKKEYGLYNVLGLEKRHVILVMFFENIISFAGQILAGSIVGVSFYRLSTLLISNILNNNDISGASVFDAKVMLNTIGVFLVLFVLSFVYNVISIKRLNPVELMKASATGEKEPKVKWILFLLGIIFLGTGYGLAVSIETPLLALMSFFIAVILVIIGTYFLFTAGSIFILKALKKNKKYYYSPEHMISVSGMLYRMKQNAAGLASIAILATGVLIMISSTVSLYGGIKESIEMMYPQDLYFNSYAYIDDENGGSRRWVTYEEAEKFLRESAEKAGLKVTLFTEEEYFETAYILENDELKAQVENPTSSTFFESGISGSNVKCITFIDTDCYNGLTGENLVLGEDEMYIGAMSGGKWKPENVKIAGLNLKCRGILTQIPVYSEVGSIVDCYLMVVSSGNYHVIFDEQAEKYGRSASEEEKRYVANISGEDEKREELFDIYLRTFRDFIGDEDIWCHTSWNSSWDMRTDLYDMNGSLMFLGILLSIVCLISTALIIYYKQISEGYDDRNKFQIMQKVGLSREEIKKTIRSQILTVFFLPLIVAGIHTLFAFPMITRLMAMLSVFGAEILLPCLGVVFAVFALVYTVIYSITAKTYYKIVR